MRDDIGAFAIGIIAICFIWIVVSPTTYVSAVVSGIHNAIGSSILNAPKYRLVVASPTPDASPTANPFLLPLGSTPIPLLP